MVEMLYDAGMTEKLRLHNRIKSFQVLLKDLEPVVKNHHEILYTGREFTSFKQRPREVLANWLLCIVLREKYGDAITFRESHEGDGVILNKQTGDEILTEHVCAMDIPLGKEWPKGNDRIIEAVNHKAERGAEYAKGKKSIVFVDGAGEINTGIIRQSIAGKHCFDCVYCISPLKADSNGYSYFVTEYYDLASITFKVNINPYFIDWSVDFIDRSVVQIGCYRTTYRNHGIESDSDLVGGAEC